MNDLDRKSIVLILFYFRIWRGKFEIIRSFLRMINTLRRIWRNWGLSSKSQLRV